MENSHEITIITWNVQHLSTTSPKAKISQIAQVILDSKAHIICLQEVHCITSLLVQLRLSAESSGRPDKWQAKRADCDRTQLAPAFLWNAQHVQCVCRPTLLTGSGVTQRPALLATFQRQEPDGTLGIPLVLLNAHVEWSSSAQRAALSARRQAVRKIQWTARVLHARLEAMTRAVSLLGQPCGRGAPSMDNSACSSPVKHSSPWKRIGGGRDGTSTSIKRTKQCMNETITTMNALTTVHNALVLMVGDMNVSYPEDDVWRGWRGAAAGTTARSTPETWAGIFDADRVPLGTTTAPCSQHRYDGVWLPAHATWRVTAARVLPLLAPAPATLPASKPALVPAVSDHMPLLCTLATSHGHAALPTHCTAMAAGQHILRWVLEQPLPPAPKHHFAVHGDEVDAMAARIAAAAPALATIVSERQFVG